MPPSNKWYMAVTCKVKTDEIARQITVFIKDEDDSDPFADLEDLESNEEDTD